MSSHQVPKPPRLSDRTFGLTLGLVLAGVALVRGFFFGGIPDWLIALAAAFFVAGVLLPSALMPVNRLVGAFAARMASVINYVLLAPFLWIVMTPMGVVMRTVGRDPMQRRFDRDSNSYFTPVVRPTNEETLRDMF